MNSVNGSKAFGNAGRPDIDRWVKESRKPAEEAEEVFVNLLSLCNAHVRDPHAEPPSCCVWRGEGFTWVHLPSLLDWLSCPVAKSRHMDWNDARKALLLLGFRYIKDHHRAAGKDAQGKERKAKASVWRGPKDLLQE
jgi:hypothetical protein